MKTYILLFLVSWFQYVYAPNDCQIYQNQTEETKQQNQKLLQKEQMRDSIDIETLKEFKMTKHFTKSDRKLTRNICDSLGIDPKHFYAIVKLESGGNRKAINHHSKAAGLIGFLPSTAKRLGTTTDEILKMSNKEQLLLTHKYFKSITKGKPMKGLVNIYLAVLYPNAVNRHDSYVIGHKGSNTVKWNKPLDTDNDSILTVKDVRKYVIAYLI